MAITTPSMGLKRWDQPNDIFSYVELSDNLALLDAHDHSAGKGVQIPTAGIVNNAIDATKLADNAVTATKIPVASITGDRLVNSTIPGSKLSSKYVEYLSGLLAARPAASTAGRWFKATDTGQTFFDTGSAWDEVLVNPHRLEIKKTSDQSCAQNVYTDLTWNTETLDPFSLHSGTSADVTIAQTGFYFVWSELQWQTAGSGQRISVIAANGSNISYDERIALASPGILVTRHAVARQLTQGTVLKARVYHDHTSALSIQSGGSVFGLARVG
jgi:hypothetical protein